MTEDNDNGIVLDVQESRSIPEGEHTGEIVSVSTRETKFGPYLDVDIDLITPEGERLTTLTAGYPAKVTTSTRLGQLLARFGENLEEGGQIDIEGTLLNEKVTFETKDVTNENGTFAEILPQTVSPA